MPNSYAKHDRTEPVPQHFYKPNNSSVWYVRLVAPRHVQQLLPRGEREFRRSTGHSDLRRARPIGQSLIADKLRQWETLARASSENSDAQPVVLHEELIESICAARLYSWLRTDQEDRESPAGLTDETLDEIEQFCELSDTAMRSVLAQGAASTRWAEAVEAVMDWCLTLGHEVDPADPSFVGLVRRFARVERDAQRAIAARNQGDDVPTPAPPAQPAKRLSDVIEPYRAFKAPTAVRKHVNTIAAAWQQLIDYAGDLPLDAVTPAVLFGFMENRINAAVKPWSELRARGFGKRALGEMFGYARTMGWIATNPLEGLLVFPSLTPEEAERRRRPRSPYTDEQLNALFASEWYDPTSQLLRGRMASDLGARYWVPLIGLFHGTRVREPLQLTPSDFSDIDGVYCLTIRADLHGAPELAAMRSVKNAATERTIPVHPGLLQLGLREFVEERRAADGDVALLFPSSLPSADSQDRKLGRAYEQAFLRHVRDRLQLGSGLGNHGLRHQLEDRIRDAQAKRGLWPAGMSQHYTGRARARSADLAATLEEGSERAYGRGYRPSALIPYIERLDFSGVKLPPPYAQWRAKKS